MFDILCQVIQEKINKVGWYTLIRKREKQKLFKSKCDFMEENDKSSLGWYVERKVSIRKFLRLVKNI